MIYKKKKFDLFSLIVGVFIGFFIALTFYYNNIPPFKKYYTEIHDTTIMSINPLSDCDTIGYPASDASMGIRSSELNLTALNSSFDTQFPGNEIHGGNIGKCVVAAILRSLPEDEKTMPYYFGYENGKIVLILKGGDATTNTNPIVGGTVVGDGSAIGPNQPIFPAGKLVYKTGTNADCFCPTQCR